jgi:hypothetical protein
MCHHLLCWLPEKTHCINQQSGKSSLLSFLPVRLKNPSSLCINTRKTPSDPFRDSVFLSFLVLTIKGKSIIRKQHRQKISCQTHIREYPWFAKPLSLGCQSGGGRGQGLRIWSNITYFKTVKSSDCILIWKQVRFTESSFLNTIAVRGNRPPY